MSNSDIEIPVAYCNTCEDRGPVVVKYFDASGRESDDTYLQVVFCPQCDNLLNMDGDVKLEWFAKEDLEEATGWRVKGG